MANMLDLPPEIREIIFNFILSELIVEVPRGNILVPKLDEAFIHEIAPHPRRRGSYNSAHNDDNTDIPNKSRFISSNLQLTPQPKGPQDIVNLRLVCRLFADEVDFRNWHAKAIYKFETPLAMLDVMTTWPKERVETIRYIYVKNLPFMLWPTSRRRDAVKFGIAKALKLLPHLRLDTLIVENILPVSSTNDCERRCNDWINDELQRLLLSNGWNHLDYRARGLNMELEGLEKCCMKVRLARFYKGEPSFDFQIRSPTSSKLEYEGTSFEIELEVNEERSAQDTNELQTLASAHRQDGIDYTQTGKGIGIATRDLFARMSWSEIRQSRGYVYSDGLEPEVFDRKYEYVVMTDMESD